MFAPKIVFAEMPAMIAPENNNSVFSEPQFIECLHQPANLDVNKAHAGVISMAEAPVPLIAVILNIAVMVEMNFP